MPDTPIEVGHVDWTQYRYRDLEEDELFWFERRISNNPAFRKVNDNEALILSSQTLLKVDPGKLVFQKEY